MGHALRRGTDETETAWLEPTNDTPRCAGIPSIAAYICCGEDLRRAIRTGPP